jgi:MEMO1 family protein
MGFGNNPKLRIIFVFFVLTAACGLLTADSCAQDIKSPNVAGSFYPADPQELSSMIEGFLAAAHPAPMPGEIFALVEPHAGYAFSGAVAAFGYKLIRGKPYHTVVVIAPSHQYGFSGVSVYPEKAFRTPLGDVPIDTEFTGKLLNRDRDIVFDPLAFQKEHALEVELPFLQKTLAGFKIVPIVMGDCTLQMCQKLAALLTEAINTRKDVLIVASSDMYHGYDYDEADKSDSATLTYLQNMDAEGLYDALREGKAQLCGGFPVVTTIMTAKQLGHKSLSLLKHTNSAEVTGKMVKGIWTVGYSSCAIDNPEEPVSATTEGAGAMLNKEQRKRLIDIARSSIAEYLKTGKRITLTENDPALKKELGAFVTLTEKGDLRGCIGHMTGDEPLYTTIADMAVEAAVHDPRFPPVLASELKDIAIEISVLSPLERVYSADKIEMGKHGVLVRRGFSSGVYLPQVAIETGWSKEEFLSSLCAHKAGLSPDAWKDPATELYVFTAEVFSEGKL